MAERDERGALHLPIREAPPVAAGLLRVRGVVRVTPHSPCEEVGPAQVRSYFDMKSSESESESNWLMMMMMM
eukprot:SAG31_NODE_33137_length_347_cov_1.012097_1_plen_71_part_10